MSNSNVNIIAVDCSGSTGNESGYWNEVANTIQLNPKSVFWFWDDKVTILNRDQALQWCKKAGRGGTYPVCMIKMLPKDTSKINLTLITDGQVSENDVGKCDVSLNSTPFASVNVKFIHTGGPMNLSVSRIMKRSLTKISKSSRLWNSNKKNVCFYAGM